MSDLFDLAAYLDDLAGRIAPAANELSKKVAAAVLEDLTMITPVDTGVALSNWQVIQGSGDGVILPAYSPSPKGKMVDGAWSHRVDPTLTRSNNAPQVLEAGMAVISSKAPGVALYIVNNVRYIGFLNEGSSSQAPSGFVDRANIIAKEMLDSLRI